MKKSDVKAYYEHIYDEDKRLSKGCDNRHFVEKVVKMKIYKNILADYPKNSRILDISCGTGLYSIELAKMGYNVYACDLCDKHINELNYKSKNMNINTCVCDACKLPFEDNSFDLVLLAGAIYHLSKNNKIKAIKEAVRVCSTGNHIIIDFLPRLHAEYQSFARYGRSLQPDDNIFSYDSKKDMKSYLFGINAKINNFFSTDGITRLISYKINSLNKSQLNKYISFCMEQSKNEDMIDISEHALMDIIKK